MWRAKGARRKDGGLAADEPLRTTQPADATGVQIPQYSIWQVLGVWAAAALPMAALAWLVAPALADRLSGEGILALVKALLVCSTVGLIWLFVLVVILIWR
jgi:uncharacterized protein